MYNYEGSFISFPTICTESEEIRVLAQCKTEAEHTVHLLNQLVNLMLFYSFTI